MSRILIKINLCVCMRVSLILWVLGLIFFFIKFYQRLPCHYDDCYWLIIPSWIRSECDTFFTLSFPNSIFLFTILFLYDLCLLSYVELEYLEGENRGYVWKLTCYETNLFNEVLLCITLMKGQHICYTSSMLHIRSA